MLFVFCVFKHGYIYVFNNHIDFAAIHFLRDNIFFLNVFISTKPKELNLCNNNAGLNENPGCWKSCSLSRRLTDFILPDILLLDKI